MDIEIFLTKKQKDKIEAFVLKTKWPPKIIYESEGVEKIVNIMKEFDWDVDDAAMFHIHQDRINSLTEEQKGKIENFIESTSWKSPSDNAGYYQLIKILEAFSWKTNEAVRFHNRRKMTPKEQVESLNNEETEQLNDFLNRMVEGAEPEGSETLATIIEMMESFDWNADTAIAYWETAKKKGRAAFEEMSDKLNDQIKSGELLGTKDDMENQVRQIMKKAENRFDQMLDSTFYDRVYSGIYKKYGL